VLKRDKAAKHSRNANEGKKFTNFFGAIGGKCKPKFLSFLYSLDAVINI
jgi:hypothetical protein